MIIYKSTGIMGLENEEGYTPGRIEDFFKIFRGLRLVVINGGLESKTGEGENPLRVNHNHKLQIVGEKDSYFRRKYKIGELENDS